MNFKINHLPLSVLVNKSTLLLQTVEDLNADFSEDIALGLRSFKDAYKKATEKEIIDNFGSVENIQPYYTNLFTEDDVKPFRKGEAIWVRALYQDKLVGWMTILPHFKEENSVYLSTFVIHPDFAQHGIAKIMMHSIREHWFSGLKDIYLITRTINRDAVRFFEQIGFTPETSIESHFLDDSKTCFFMINSQQLTGGNYVRCNDQFSSGGVNNGLRPKI